MAETNPEHSSPMLSVDALLRFALLTVIVLAAASWLILTLAHISDGFKITPPSGTWMALAQHLNQGTLYPPLFDRGTYGGTRYMPLHFVALAGVAKVTGEYLMAGKIIAFASMMLLLSSIFMLLRHNRCPTLLAIGMVSTIPLTGTGLFAAHAIRGDALALALQLGALWFISRSENRTATILAALLCTLALLTKMSAVWTPAAIGLVLLFTNRPRLLLFVLAYVLATLGSLVLVNALSDGRMAENFLGFSASGIRGCWAIAWWSTPRMVAFLATEAPACFALLPLAMLATIAAVCKREFAVHHAALFTCGAVMVVLFADVGVGENHLIDLFAITIIVTGDFVARINRQPADTGAIGVKQIVIAIVIWMNITAFISHGWTDFREATTALVQRKIMPRYDLSRITAAIQPGDIVLSEDPTLPVLLDPNRTPILLDAFSLRHMEASHPEWIASLVDRIAKREFTKILLTHPPDPRSWWCTELAFGPTVATAIAQHYQLHSQIETTLFYVPQQ